MGKKSRERMTGLTEEQRIANPINYKQGPSIIRLQKQINKQQKAIRNFMKMLYKTGRIGKG